MIKRAKKCLGKGKKHYYWNNMADKTDVCLSFTIILLQIRIIHFQRIVTVVLNHFSSYGNRVLLFQINYLSLNAVQLRV
jgi:hypothetical protein